MIKLNTESRKKFVKSFPNYFTKGAEIGVSSGDFSKNILSSAPNIKLWCIDIWEKNYQLPNPDSSYQQTLNNLSKYGLNRFEIIKEGSPKSALRFEDDFFDFVYIDADHNYEAVVKDLEAWYPKVKNGGIFFGHDYSAPWDGVIQAVNEFCIKNQYTVGEIEALGLNDGDQDGGAKSWFIIKK